MKYYTGYSLVDITATGVKHHRPEREFARNQQRNWETVLQALSIRTQPQDIQGPVSFNAQLDTGWNFGEMYQGQHRVWAFTFGIETSDVFLEGDDPLAGLLSDFEQVPVIPGLLETARFILPIFYPHGGIRNISFSANAINLNNL
jgi:hypothetical protein